MSNYKDLENILREKSEQMDVQFDAKEWSKMEARLDNTFPKQKSPISAYLSIGALVIAGASLAFALGSSDNEIAETKEVITPQEVVLPKDGGNTNKVPSSVPNNPEETGVNAEVVAPIENREETKVVIPAEKLIPAQELKNAQKNEQSTQEMVKELPPEEVDPPKVTDTEAETEATKSAATKELFARVEGPAVLTVCIGEELILNGTATFGATLAWFIDGVRVKGDNQVKVSFNEAGLHTVDFKGMLDGKESVENITISVSNNPVSYLQVDQDYSMGNLYSFQLDVSNVQNVQWFVNDEPVVNPSQHIILGKGNKEVKATYEANGCTYEMAETVEVRGDYNLGAQTALAVGGFFMPVDLRLLEGEFVLEIIDKEAKQVVYRTNSVDEPWDGNSMITGSRVDAKSYVWRVTVISSNSAIPVRAYSGPLTVF